MVLYLFLSFFCHMKRFGILILVAFLLHACKNVFVTDGASMTSTGNQSPSILYMALTARAANYAVSELKKGNL